MNSRGQSPVDFESTSLTTRTRCPYKSLLSLVAEHSLCKRKVGGSTPPVGCFCHFLTKLFFVFILTTSEIQEMCPYNFLYVSLRPPKKFWDFFSESRWLLRSRKKKGDFGAFVDQKTEKSLIKKKMCAGTARSPHKKFLKVFFLAFFPPLEKKLQKKPKIGKKNKGKKLPK